MDGPIYRCLRVVRQISLRPSDEFSPSKVDLSIIRFPIVRSIPIWTYLKLQQSIDQYIQEDLNELQLKIKVIQDGSRIVGWRAKFPGVICCNDFQPLVNASSETWRVIYYQKITAWQRVILFTFFACRVGTITIAILEIFYHYKFTQGKEGEKALLTNFFMHNMYLHIR